MQDFFETPAARKHQVTNFHIFVSAIPAQLHASRISSEQIGKFDMISIIMRTRIHSVNLADDNPR